MYRSRARRPRGVLLLVSLLLAPPLAGVLLREFRPGSPAASSESEAGEIRRLRVEVAKLRQRFQREGRERELLSSWDRAYDPVIARVLPVSDVSPQRQSFLIALPRELGAQEDFVVVSDGALVGRVKSFLPGTSIARVQSILDRGFVVRFRYGDSWGFLRGTGRVDARGCPLLRIELKGQSEIAFEKDRPVFTDGDGLFPPDILIGHLDSSPLADSLEPYHVVADGRPDILRDVVVLKDPRLDGTSREAPQ